MRTSFMITAKYQPSYAHAQNWDNGIMEPGVEST